MPSAYVQQNPRPALRWIAVFCALAVWLVGLLAASPRLHAALHADANHADHECAITLFSHGLDEGPGNTCLTCAPLLKVESESAIQPVSPVAAALHRLPPGRGPPLR